MPFFRRASSSVKDAEMEWFESIMEYLGDDTEGADIPPNGRQITKQCQIPTHKMTSQISTVTLLMTTRMKSLGATPLLFPTKIFEVTFHYHYPDMSTIQTDSHQHDPSMPYHRSQREQHSMCGRYHSLNGNSSNR
jgi:hypothetical protein